MDPELCINFSLIVPTPGIYRSKGPKGPIYLGTHFSFLAMSLTMYIYMITMFCL